MEGLERSPGEGKGRRRHPGRKCIRAQIAVLCVAPSAPDLRPTYVLRMNHSRAPRAENTQGAPGGRREAGMGPGGDLLLFVSGLSDTEISELVE